MEFDSEKTPLPTLGSLPRTGWTTVALRREGFAAGTVLLSGMIDWERFYPASMKAYRTRIAAQAAADEQAERARDLGRRVIAHSVQRHVWVVFAVDRGMATQERSMLMGVLDIKVLPSLLDRVRDRL